MEVYIGTKEFIEQYDIRKLLSPDGSCNEEEIEKLYNLKSPNDLLDAIFFENKKQYDYKKDYSEEWDLVGLLKKYFAHNDIDINAPIHNNFRCKIYEAYSVVSHTPYDKKGSTYYKKDAIPKTSYLLNQLCSGVLNGINSIESALYRFIPPELRKEEDTFWYIEKDKKEFLSKPQSLWRFLRDQYYHINCKSLYDAIVYLVEQGADINAVDSYGETPLSYALQIPPVFSSYIVVDEHLYSQIHEEYKDKIISFLLEKGASCDFLIPIYLSPYYEHSIFIKKFNNYLKRINGRKGIANSKKINLDIFMLLELFEKIISNKNKISIYSKTNKYSPAKIEKMISIDSAFTHAITKDAALHYDVTMILNDFDNMAYNKLLNGKTDSFVIEVLYKEILWHYEYDKKYLPFKSQLAYMLEILYEQKILTKDNVNEPILNNFRCINNKNLKTIPEKSYLLSTICRGYFMGISPIKINRFIKMPAGKNYEMADSIKNDTNNQVKFSLFLHDYYYAFKSIYDAAKFLISIGADVNAVDSFNETALSYLLQYKVRSDLPYEEEGYRKDLEDAKYDCVKLLVDNGANTKHIVDNAYTKKKTILAIAKQARALDKKMGHTKTKNILELLK